MVIEIKGSLKRKRPNFFMTDEEVRILWDFSKQWSTKWQVMIGFALFRGLRIGEIVAINLYDFQGEKFQKMSVILQKSNIQDTVPLLQEFNELLMQYIKKNLHSFKDGYIFPYYNRRNGKAHMTQKTAIAMFSKIRKKIGEKHPSFLDTVYYPEADGKKRIVNLPGKPTLKRHRITWHSLRRYFETRIWKEYKDKMLLRDVMRYNSTKPCEVYVDPYEVWDREQQILQDVFGDFFNSLNNVKKGQQRLTKYF